MAKYLHNGAVIATGPIMAPETIAAQFNVDADEVRVKLDRDEWKAIVRGRIQSNVADSESLLGKTANFTAALAAINLDVFSKLAVANSFEDVRDSVGNHLPLMQLLSEKIEAGEILTVQAAQGMSDQDAILEALEAMTAVAAEFSDMPSAGKSVDSNTAAADLSLPV